MKEATGELNATVIVVITIGILSAFFFTVLWPMLNNNLHKNTGCAQAWCEKCPKHNCKTVKCYYYSDKAKTKKVELTCPYKG